MKNYFFQGKIEKGKFIFKNEDVYKRFVENADEGKYQVYFNKAGKVRSDAANRYYWGVIVKELCEFCGYPAYEKENLHEALKQEFLSTESMAGLETHASTKNLYTWEFNDYIGKIIQWAELEYSLMLPEPNEFDIHQRNMGDFLSKEEMERFDKAENHIRNKIGYIPPLLKLSIFQFAKGDEDAFKKYKNKIEQAKAQTAQRKSFKER